MSNWQPPGRSALDDTPWPETLIARAALRKDSDDQLHGYEILGDVARYFAHSDVIYLSIAGELPDPRSSTIFHIAMCSLAVIGVNEAPCHVGVLSRICGGTFASAIGAATIVLADQAHDIVARNAPLPTQPAGTAEPFVGSLMSALASRGVTVPELAWASTREVAQLFLLQAAGLQRSDQMEAAIVIARISGLTAELLQTGPEHLRDYPVKLPPFHYVESER